MKPKRLIKILEELPDKPILCQLVGQEDGRAWNMFFDFQDVPDTSFIQLRIEHPELKQVPDMAGSREALRNAREKLTICPDCHGDGYQVTEDRYGYPERWECELCESTGIAITSDIPELTTEVDPDLDLPF